MYILVCSHVYISISIIIFNTRCCFLNDIIIGKMYVGRMDVGMFAGLLNYTRYSMYTKIKYRIYF